MNHYVYFTALQMDLPEMPPEWFTEGIAEYFAQTTIRKKRSMLKSSTSEFNSRNGGFYDNYWVGFSVFTFMDKKFGKQKVRQCVKKSYNNVIDHVFVSELNTTLSNFDYQWKEYIYYNY